MPSPFKILGIPEGSTVETVKEQYRQLALAHHPDRGGSAAVFTELNKAYQKALQSAEDHHAPGRCVQCDGTGWVTRRRGFTSLKMVCQDCPAAEKIFGRTRK